MKRLAAALPVALLAAAPVGAWAYELTTVDQLTQNEFKLLSEDLGAALSFKPIIPSEASGLTGFDLGVAVSATQLKNAVLLSKAANSATVRTTMPLVSARVHKGLPANIDIGGTYTMVPETGIRVYGGEFRWAVLPGSTAVPAVALRFSGSKLSGVDQLDFSTFGADVSVSKGFAIFTPYGGIGINWVRDEAKGIATLQAEKFTQPKVFVGVNVNLGVNLAFEYDNTGGRNSASAKIGFRF